MEPHVERKGERLTPIIACLGPRTHTLWTRGSGRTWLACLLLFTVLAFALAPLLAALVPGRFQWQPHRIPSLLAVVPLKALKEEILFRALPFALLTLAVLPRRTRPLLSQGAFLAVSACVFVLAHEINFRYVRNDPMALSTLATLGFFGLLTGALYVRQGHLLGCLALHAGWNVMRFQLDMIDARGRVLSETAGFDALEGSWLLLGLTALLATVLSREAFPRASLRFRRRCAESPSTPVP